MIAAEHPDFANTPVSPDRPTFHFQPLKPNPAPTVSVITPYFNTDEVFLETAQSVLGQSFQDFEWIIVDDGSTDPAAVARLQTVQARDPRIKIVSQKNAGPAAARNTAFRNSCGPYICQLDSDDLLEPTFIEKCVWFLESNPNFGFCNAWSVIFGSEEFLWRTGFERGKLHLEANSGPNMSLIRRAAFQDAGGLDESIRFGHEDWDFWLALAKAGYWGHNLPEYLMWYRKRTDSRFHQVMRSDSGHRDFEALIAKKYAGLDADFPNPTIRHPEAYETVSPEIPFDNVLTKPDDLRRILFLLPWMVTGGADKVNLDWIAALTQNGYEVSICATLESTHNWLPEFAKLTPDIFVLPNFLRTADFPRFLRYLINSRQIDTVLISASTFGYQVLPYLRTHCPGVTFVDLCHAEEPHWMNGGHPRFGVGYQDMLDLNLVTTGHLRDWMLGRGADPERITVCHTGIQVAPHHAMDRAQARSRARQKFKLDPEIPVIIFAGRLCEQKRPKFLAEILHDLTARGARFHALIIGDGELRQDLEDSLHNMKLTDTVQMLGSVTHEVWLQALVASDIFLLPSQYEGISVALLEAMAMGVVPVTAAVGGQGESVTPECGFLIPPGGPERVAYVDALIRLTHDASLRQSMGTSCRQRISDQFSLSATRAGFLQALERARSLASVQPRLPISRGLAQELATLAVEYTRLNTVASFLWSQKGTTRAGGSAPVPVLPMQGLLQLLESLAATRIGYTLLRSRRLRRFGRWLITKLESRHQATSRPE